MKEGMSFIINDDETLDKFVKDCIESTGVPQQFLNPQELTKQFFRRLIAASCTHRGPRIIDHNGY